ncbi:hypothetical protein GCM10009839_46980 [Catenulispora yoronensis]|uniref:DNA-binding protein n=1 Tax=Catenulispora yoronensis TaxID=450799 RepID=A0ABN2UKY0_9ACTN
MSAETQTAAATEALLDAGAVIPWTGGPDDRPGDREDVLQARAYQHPALEGRTVVRLVPRALGEAEDLTMEFLGFGRLEADTADVGVVLRKSLGFPAWALVNDPANGHHALALVKEIERLGRQARNKPGLAKEGFDALGKRLAAAVPHFLPSYYEQVGRMFLTAENKNYAATMFTKARDAERAHGLPVDEDVLAESFLEFALNGALPAKAVGEYARALSARTAAPEAFQRFRLLVTERTSGGLPPYATLAADMKRLAKAAGLNVVEQEISLLRDLLDQPALVRAAKPFWVSYAPSLVKLAKAEPAVRGKLLAMNPAFPGADTGEAEAFWLDLLAECGALEALTAPIEQVPAEALPSDGAAGWLARFVAHRGRRWRRMPALQALVERMAPRLRAEGTPLDVVDQHRVDADLIDLCLDLGLPLVVDPDPRRVRRFDVDAWLDPDDPSERRGLAAFAADEYFSTLIDSGLDQFAAGSSYNNSHKTSPIADRFAELASAPGLLVGVSRWLEHRAAQVDSGGLPQLHAVLHLVRRAASAPVVAVNPEPVRHVATFDVAPVLAHALRSGILDEYSWPALDAACAKLSGIDVDADPGASVPTASDGRYEVVEQWPYLLVKKDANIAVVDGTGTVLEHLAAIPPAQQIWNFTLRHADGQLLILWRGPGISTGYWSGEPLRMLEASDFGYFSGSVTSMEIPGHGRSFGGRPLRAGDTTIEESGTIVSDGTTYWRLNGMHGTVWNEFDPATGAIGRASLPSFFEDRLPDGRTLRRHLCWVRPVVPGTEASPLGAADGLLGWRVHQSAGSGAGIGSGSGSGSGFGSDEALVGEAVDGRSFRLDLAVEEHGSDIPVGLVAFPGSAASSATTSAMTVGNHGWGQWNNLTLTDASQAVDVSHGRKTAELPVGERAPKYAKGTWCVPPVDYWHYLVPRDEAASGFLRTIDAARARALMEAAKRGLKGFTDSEDAAGDDTTDNADALTLAPIVEAVRTELPEVTHPNLIAGIAGYVREAIEREADVTRIAEALDAHGEADDDDVLDPRLTLPPWNIDLMAAAANLADVGRAYYNETPLPPGISLSHLVSAFQGKDISKQQHGGAKMLQAVDLLAALPALAYRAASPIQPDAVRRTLSQLVAAVAASGITDAASGIRGVRNVQLDGPDVKRTDTTGRVLPTPNGCVVLCAVENEYRDNQMVIFWHGVQLSATETFDEKIDGWTLTVRNTVGRWPEGLLDRVADLLASGPFAWDPSAAERFATATGLTVPEAVIALAGLPGVQRYGGSKLDPETRNRLGLKPAQAKAAFSQFERISDQARVKLLTALAGADIAELWTKGPDVEAAAAWWVEQYGRRAAVSEELITEAHTALKLRNSWRTRIPVSDILQGLSDLGSWQLMQTPFTAADAADSSSYGDSKGLGEDRARDVARALLWLAYRLPYGDPLRAVLPEAARLLRDRLCDTGTRINSGWVQGVDRLETTLGIQAVATDDPSPEDAPWVKIGPFRARLGNNGWYLTQVVPGDLSGADDPALDLMVVLGPGGSAVPLLRTVLSGALDAVMVEPEVGEPYPAQDPTRSVPHLVEAAATRLSLSPDAAALYLMLLALPDPTDRNTAAWTGWKPARLKAARAELSATELVVTGTRARAGRTMFLPGAWHAFGAPVLPVEAWKSRWLGISAQGRVELDIIVPRLPVVDLFEAAWQRVVDGDPPRLEELKTGRRR